MKQLSFSSLPSQSWSTYIHNFPIPVGRVYKLLHPCSFIFLVYSRHFLMFLNSFHNDHLQKLQNISGLFWKEKQWRRARKWGVSGDVGRGSHLPSFLPLQEFQLPALPAPVHPHGALREEPRRGTPRAPCGTVKEGLCPSPFLLPPPVFKLGQRSGAGWVWSTG